MSIAVNIGQCGVEIGHEMFKTIQRHMESTGGEEGSSFYNNFENGVKPNAVIIDTEEKVIDSVIRKDSGVDYREVVQKFSGSGNNWAYDKVLGTINSPSRRSRSGLSEAFLASRADPRPSGVISGTFQGPKKHPRYIKKF